MPSGHPDYGWRHTVSNEEGQEPDEDADAGDNEPEDDDSDRKGRRRRDRIRTACAVVCALAATWRAARGL